LADLARADVATKCDLDHLGLVTKLELEITKAELRQEIHSEIRSLMIFHEHAVRCAGRNRLRRTSSHLIGPAILLETCCYGSFLCQSEEPFWSASRRGPSRR
jgi:hypothetical protein